MTLQTYTKGVVKKSDAVSTDAVSPTNLADATTALAAAAQSVRELAAADGRAPDAPSVEEVLPFARKYVDFLGGQDKSAAAVDKVAHFYSHSLERFARLKSLVGAFE